MVLVSFQKSKLKKLSSHLTIIRQTIIERVEFTRLFLVFKNIGSLSTVVGDEKLTSREDLIGLLFFYVQSDEDTFLKVDEVSKTEAQPFDVFNQLVGSFQFCV